MSLSIWKQCMPCSADSLFFSRLCLLRYPLGSARATPLGLRAWSRSGKNPLVRAVDFLSHKDAHDLRQCPAPWKCLRLFAAAVTVVNAVGGTIKALLLSTSAQPVCPGCNYTDCIRDVCKVTLH